MAKIYLIRHGETEWNKEERSQGKGNDIELSRIGLLQAEKLSKRLSKCNIDYFYSSTLKRAYKTASIIAAPHRKNVEREEDFMEFGFGCWEGLRYNEIIEKYNDIFKIWRDCPTKVNIPDGESIHELKERSMGRLMKILKAYPESNILIVSHGITIKTMIASMLKIDLSNMHSIRQDNTALNIFEYKDNKFYTIVLNDTCHLKENQYI